MRATNHDFDQFIVKVIYPFWTHRGTLNMFWALTLNIDRFTLCYKPRVNVNVMSRLACETSYFNKSHAHLSCTQRTHMARKIRNVIYFQAGQIKHTKPFVCITATRLWVQISLNWKCVPRKDTVLNTKEIFLAHLVYKNCSKYCQSMYKYLYTNNSDQRDVTVKSSVTRCMIAHSWLNFGNTQSEK